MFVYLYIGMWYTVDEVIDIYKLNKTKQNKKLLYSWYSIGLWIENYTQLMFSNQCLLLEWKKKRCKIWTFVIKTDYFVVDLISKQFFWNEDINLYKYSPYYCLLMEKIDIGDYNLSSGKMIYPIPVIFWIYNRVRGNSSYYLAKLNSKLDIFCIHITI